METLFLTVSKFAMSAKHDLQMPRQIVFAEQVGYPGDALAFIARNLQQGELLPRPLPQ